MEEKENLRKEFLKKRKIFESGKADSKIMKNLLNSLRFQNCKKIFTYVSNEGEVDTHWLIDNYPDRKTIAAPRVEGKEMKFYVIGGFNDLEKGFAGILEPKKGLPEAKLEDGKTILLVPAVLFDSECYRVGQGGGYYDKFLDKHKSKNFHKIGLGYGFQVIEKVPREEHDLPLDLVITENGIISPQSCSSRSK